MASEKYVIPMSCIVEFEVCVSLAMSRTERSGWASQSATKISIYCVSCLPTQRDLPSDSSSFSNLRY
ncbi:hypothetical protein Y032_0107g3782 [Ancylostoma ceylanicum]|uniref:Uncharacterized protein n=1 Tax=Ancylostoma ceylanicum TaxID=53326 RepID=A0A016TFM0_9BILA|nr:hypothetical protein Y032_0107g3782 [Ancylostoma ceylanicum]